MNNNERVQQLKLQIEELSNKVQETRKVFFEKEYIINQDIKVKDVRYYATPIANKIILENGFIINYDGSFDVSISSFSTRGVFSDEAKKIEKAIRDIDNIIKEEVCRGNSLITIPYSLFVPNDFSPDERIQFVNKLEEHYTLKGFIIVIYCNDIDIRLFPKEE